MLVYHQKERTMSIWQNRQITKTETEFNTKVKSLTEEAIIVYENQGFRYKLYWGHPDHKKICAFLMLKPAPLKEVEPNQTIKHCKQIAKLEGYESFVIINLYAYIAPSADVMAVYAQQDEVQKNLTKMLIGEHNDEVIKSTMLDTLRGPHNLVIAAWGDNRVGEIKHLIHWNKRIQNLYTRSWKTTFHISKKYGKNLNDVRDRIQVLRTKGFEHNTSHPSSFDEEKEITKNDYDLEKFFHFFADLEEKE